jgi:hypothetical protein
VFSLIITIISIALVAALAVAVIYYGGESQRQGAAKAAAATLLNQGAQIAGAGAVAVAQGPGWPEETPFFSQPYLTAMPVPPKSAYHSSVVEPAATDWTYYVPRIGNHFVLDRKIRKDVCFEINKATGLIGIPAAWDGKNIIQCFGPSEPYTFFYDPPGKLTPTETEESIDKSVGDAGPGATPGYPRLCPDGTTINTGLCPSTGPAPGGGTGGGGGGDEGDSTTPPDNGTTYSLTTTPSSITADGYISDGRGGWKIWHTEDYESTFDIRPDAHMEFCPVASAPQFEEWEWPRVFINGVEKTDDFGVWTQFNYDNSSGTAPSTPKVCAYLTGWYSWLPQGPITIELQRDSDTKRYRGTFTVIPGGEPAPTTVSTLSPHNPVCGDTVTAHGMSLPTSGYASAEVIRTGERRLIPFTYVSSEQVTFKIPKDWCNAGTTGVILTNADETEYYEVQDYQPLVIGGLDAAQPAMTFVGAEGGSNYLPAATYKNTRNVAAYFTMSSGMESALRNQPVTISVNGQEGAAYLVPELDLLQVDYQNRGPGVGGKWFTLDLSNTTTRCIYDTDRSTSLHCGRELMAAYSDETSSASLTLNVVIKAGGVVLAQYTMSPTDTNRVDHGASGWWESYHYNMTGGSTVYYSSPVYGISSWD